MIPPLPCLLGFVLGLACDWGWPWPPGLYEYVLPAGVLLAVVVVAAMVTLLRAFSRHDTSPGPERRDNRHRRHWGPSGSRAIRPMSPRGFSRRSWGCSSTMSGFCSRIMPAMIVIHYVVVLREEAYLEEKFGEAYRDYKSRVRRWI